MKPWDDRGYRTWNERQQDNRDLARGLKDFNDNPRKGDPLDVQYDDDVVQAWKDHQSKNKAKEQLYLKGRDQAHRQFTVSPEDLKRARREDALMFLSIGAFIGFGLGLIVGVWLAVR